MLITTKHCLREYKQTATLMGNGRVLIAGGSQGQSVAEAIRAIGVTEVTYGTSF